MFLHACPSLGPVALDFAVTCPLQQSMQLDASRRSLAAAMDYEAHKLEDRDTSQRCRALGVKLVPILAETLGGWGPAAQEFFRVLARASAHAAGVGESTATNQLYQALGVRLQRANARAILTRIAAISAASCDNTALAATSRSEAALVLAAAESANR